MKVALCQMARWEQDLEDPKSELCRGAVCIDLQGRCKGGTPVPCFQLVRTVARQPACRGRLGEGAREGAWPGTKGPMVSCTPRDVTWAPHLPQSFDDPIQFSSEASRRLVEVRKGVHSVPILHPMRGSNSCIVPSNLQAFLVGSFPTCCG